MTQDGNLRKYADRLSAIIEERKASGTDATGPEKILALMQKIGNGGLMAFAGNGHGGAEFLLGTARLLREHASADEDLAFIGPVAERIRRQAEAVATKAEAPVAVTQDAAQEQRQPQAQEAPAKVPDQPKAPRKVERPKQKVQRQRPAASAAPARPHARETGLSAGDEAAGSIPVGSLNDLIAKSNLDDLKGFDAAVRAYGTDMIGNLRAQGLSKEDMLRKAEEGMGRKMKDFPSRDSAILSTRASIILRDMIEKDPAVKVAERQRVARLPTYGMA